MIIEFQIIVSITTTRVYNIDINIVQFVIDVLMAQLFLYIVFIRDQF